MSRFLVRNAKINRKKKTRMESSDGCAKRVLVAIKILIMRSVSVAQWSRHLILDLDIFWNKSRK